MTRPRKRDSERGTSAVEGALSLFLFLLFILAIGEGARFLNIQQALTNAAREGARLGVVPLRGTSTLASAGDVDSEVRRFLASANIPNANISVERLALGGTNYTRVTVTTGYRVTTLAMFSPLEVDLSGISLMRNETSP